MNLEAGSGLSIEEKRDRAARLAGYRCYGDEREIVDWLVMLIDARGEAEALYRLRKRFFL